MSAADRSRRYAALTEQAVRRQQFARRFGQNLRRVRRAADLSQDDLADLADVHRTGISQFERGVRLPRVDTLWRIVQCLDCDLAELCAGLGPQAEPPGAQERGRGEG